MKYHRITLGLEGKTVVFTEPVEMTMDKNSSFITIKVQMTPENMMQIITFGITFNAVDGLIFRVPYTAIITAVQLKTEEETNK